MAKLFLGLDSSPQSLSAVVVDLDRRKVVYDKSLNFDRTLPKYRTRNGVLLNRDPLIKHSPPLMSASARRYRSHPSLPCAFECTGIFPLAGVGNLPKLLRETLGDSKLATFAIRAADKCQPAYEN